MIRSFALLAISVKLVAGHPQCFTNSRPPDADQTELFFCPNEQFGGDVFLQYGSCCTEMEEDVVQAKFLEAGELTAECATLYKELLCTQCHSFSSHLFERLGVEFGPFDGMTLKQEYCDALVSACAGQVAFGGLAEYGVSYCEQHVGGSDDQYWSYPYTDPPILEPGLNLVFPNIRRVDIPELAITIRLTPDASEYWIAGIEGQVSRIPAADRNTDEIFDVLDLTDKDIFYVDYEEGLLDLAFDPKFTDNKFFYVSHTINTGTAEDVDQFNRISRFTYVVDDPAATLASELVVLTSAMKFNSVHSAGWLGFKPSAYTSPADFNDLYWVTGDGGPQTDPFQNSQDTTNLIGSMMRISMPTVAGYTSPDGKPYDIPSGNYQDVDSSAAPEVCAVGFRNPWRCSFDRLDDTLWCGDVGQNQVESIDIVECGKNYGWSRFEGSACFVPDSVEGVPDKVCSENTDRSGYEFPVYQYCHPDYDATDPDTNGGFDFCGDREIEGLAVIGGFVYRGSYFSDLLYGAYIFADLENRNVYFIQQNEEGVYVSGTIISDGTAWIVSMAEDENGEILLLTRNRQVFYLPCGDLCASSCLAQAEEQPEIESLGCFADSETNRALTLDAPGLCEVGAQFMSPDVCASYCATLPNAVYAGVENGSFCFCGAAGEDFDKNGALDDESCQALCESNPGSTCGGLDAIEVFEIGEPVAPFTPSPNLVLPTLAPGATVPPTLTAGGGGICPGTGIPDGFNQVCCPASCGACGGSGCQNFPGGSGDCCVGGTRGIVANAGDCATTGAAPCVLGDDPATPAPETPATPAPVNDPGTPSPVTDPATPAPGGGGICPAGGIPDGFNQICCPESCGACGGSGCQNFPGGNANCCIGGARGVLANAGDCATTGAAPCVLGDDPATPAPETPATPSPVADPATPAPGGGGICPAGGIPDGFNQICCPESCGACGGSGCQNFPGGNANCCVGGARGVLANAGDCATTGAAPCVLGDDPPTPGPATPTTPAPVTSPVEGGESCPEGGIPDGFNQICCPESCGACGGSGCQNFPGGNANCCIGGTKGVLANAGDCATTGAAPCVL